MYTHLHVIAFELGLSNKIHNFLFSTCMGIFLIILHCCWQLNYLIIIQATSPAFKNSTVFYYIYTCRLVMNFQN